jgi:hypothetical protein
MTVQPNRTPAFALDQYLLDGVRDPYDGDTHYLKDYSFAGDNREKRLGHCVEFNGVDQYVSTGISSIDPSVHDFTISVHCKFDNIGNDRNLFQQLDGTGTGRSWLFFEQSASSMVCYIGGVPGIDFNFLPVINTDYHFVLTWSSATNTATLYVNGVLYSSGTQTAESSDGEIILGCGKNLVSQFFDGTLYDARIYTNILTQDEITHLYTFGKSGTDPGVANLLGHWWMQEEAGRELYDSSGNGRHATIVNYATTSRIADNGVQWNVNNEVGHSGFHLFTGVAGQQVLLVPEEDAPSKTSMTVTFDILINNADEGVLFGIPGISNAFLGAYSTATSGVAHRSYGSVTIKVDGVEIANDRQDLSSALGVGVWRNVELSNIDLSVRGKAFYLAGYQINPWYIDATVRNLTVDGVDFPGPYPLPPLDNSTTQDALGGELTYTGKVPMYGLAKHVAWQGNGTDVYVATDFLWEDLRANNNWEFEFVTKGTGYTTGTDTGYGNGILVGGSNQVRIRLASNSVVATSSLVIDPLELTKVKVVRDSDDFHVTANGVTETIVPGVGGTNQGTDPILIATTSGGNFGDLDVAYLKITLNGVTTTYVPIEGTRHVAKLTSDSSDTKIIYDAVNGGTLSTLYSQGNGSWRLPHIENGGRWAGQNLLTYSEDYTTRGSIWRPISGGLTITSDATSGPFSGTTAQLIEHQGSLAFHMSSITVAANTRYILSSYVKPNVADIVALSVGGGGIGGTDGRIRWNVSDYSLFASGGFDYGGVENIGNGWYRIWGAFTTGVDTNIDIQSVLFMDSLQSTTGQSGYTYGIQLNEGNEPALYNKTTGTIWPASSLIPADTTGVSPDGNAANIPAGAVDRYGAVLIDRTGGILSPKDYELGLNNLQSETGNKETKTY